MRDYIIRRTLLFVPTVIGVTLLIFIVLRVLPGDPLRVVLGAEGSVAYILSDEELANARASLGLDKPLYQQYLGWLADIAQGDLGNSFWREAPLSEVISRRGPITAQIAVMATILSWVLGLPVGIVGALKRNTLLDYFTRSAATFGLAVPSFWVGVIVVTVTVLVFSWRPPLGIVYFWDEPIQNLQLTIFPALALGVTMTAVIARMARSTILEIINEEYVRTARSKGLGGRTVITRHVLKNAMLPVITISGLQFANLLGGSVAVEKAFSVPGLGTALITAITDRDWPFIQNLVLLYAMVFMVVNMLIDLSYAWLDPRIRYD